MSLTTALKYLWASPASAVGITVALLATLLGGAALIHSGVLEITLLRTRMHSRKRWLPFSAITLGHVVIAVHQDDQERFRSHERVHVAQYERWGLLLLLAYPLESLWQLLKGKRPYLDNRFETEARRLAETMHSTQERTHEII